MNKKVLFLLSLLVSTLAVQNTSAVCDLRCKDLRTPLGFAVAFALITEYFHRLEQKADFKSRFSVGTFVCEMDSMLKNICSLHIPSSVKSMKELLKQVWYFYRDEIAGQTDVEQTLDTVPGIDGYGLWFAMWGYIKPLKSVKDSIVLIATLGILSNSKFRENIFQLIKDGDWGIFDTSAIAKVKN